MILFSFVLVVLSVVFEDTTALKCYTCTPDNEWCFVDECGTSLSGEEQTYCFSTRAVPADGGPIKELSLCSSPSDLAIYTWSGQCVDINTLNPGSRGCRCDTDLCNADCGCEVTRTQRLIPDPAASVPPEREDTPLKCRSYGNETETCQEKQKSCVAKLTRGNDGRESITRHCDEIYSVFTKKYWNEENCLEVEDTSETTYACRCFTDMCNDDCKCGVPDYTGPGSTAGQNREPAGDDDDGGQQRGEEDSSTLAYPSGAYSSSNATWLIRILIVKWCFTRLF